MSDSPRMTTPQTTASSSATTKNPSPNVSSTAAAAPTTTSPAAHPHHHRSMTVRHAGRAHIRGKIRRIWRPRYLELCDNGLVRYYEITDEQDFATRNTFLLPNSDKNHPHNNNNNDDDDDNDITKSPQQNLRHHHNMIPKCTLCIWQARIIDVTTLRDLHVGLPMGTFGFVFHGTRVWQTTAAVECHVPETPVPRDFFCAVTTLEEAQSWVVALQWAAQRQRPSIFHSSSSSGWRVADSSTSWHVMMGEEVYDEEEEDMYSSMRGSSNYNKQNAFQVVRSSSFPKSRPGKKKQRPVSSSSSSKSARKAGKIVVTKVRALQWVRMGYHFKLAYHIHVLLLREQEGTENDKDDMVVEERAVLRTPDDIRTMLGNLQDELDATTTKKKSSALAGAQATLTKVQKVIHRHVPSASPHRYDDMVQSLKHVDDALRTLAMNAFICNSQVLRRFWSLGIEAPAVLTTKEWWTIPKRHDSCGLYSHRWITPAPSNTDEFVRQWLHQGEQERQSKFQQDLRPLLLWLAQRPSVVVGGAASLLIVLPYLWAWYERLKMTIRIRVDVLLFSWFVSLLVGRVWEQSYPWKLSDKAKVDMAARPVSKKKSKEKLHEDETDASLVDVLSSDEEEEQEIDDDQKPVVEEEEEAHSVVPPSTKLSSPLPEHPSNDGVSCWSRPPDDIFHVRGANYLNDRVKIPSAPAPFVCRGVDIWLTDNPERHIARHPSVLGGKLGADDTFLVNFLLPFGNFVAYFSIPPIEQFPPRLANVWTKFLEGDQEYRDARLKLLPVVVDGPWIVRTAVGPGTSPALLGKVIPLQYYFRSPSEDQKAAYEVDVIITASRIAKGILSVVKGHTKSLTMAFAFIIEAAEEADLPETVLCTFQMHSIYLEDCPQLPECNLDELS